MALVEDPVCEMVFPERSAAAWSVYQGQTYYFCHWACKNLFDADPSAYVQGEDPELENAPTPRQARDTAKLDMHERGSGIG